MDGPTDRLPAPLSPTEPAASVSVGKSDTTVMEIGPRDRPGGDGRPPGTPRWMLALMAAVIAIALYWWFAQTQRTEEVALNATVTAVNQATATAEAASAAAAVAQATATAAQELAQATQQAQATAGAQQIVAANATAAAEAAVAGEARATAQAIAVELTVGALATQSAPSPTLASTATPVVVVVTATPAAPATASPTAAPPPTATAAPAPPAAPAPVPPAAGSTAPAAPGPSVLPSPSTSDPGPPAGSPVPAPAASPVSVQTVARGGASSITVTPGQPATLRCLDDRVEVQVSPGDLPAQTILTCRPVQPGTLPDPPGPLVANTAFELTTSPGAGQTLPGTVDLTVTYPDAAVPADQRDQVVLGYLDGTTWTPLPAQEAAPDATRVSAGANRAGIYGLYQQP